MDLNTYFPQTQQPRQPLKRGPGSRPPDIYHHIGPDYPFLAGRGVSDGLVLVPRSRL